ncbi:MAG: hypothetical protein AABN33_18265 [Acidobacteriota bacterium]
MSAQPSDKQTTQRRMIAIIATWKKLRPDLAHDQEDLRASRLEFAASVLGIPPIDSLTELTAGQLGRVLDKLREVQGFGFRVQGSAGTVESSRVQGSAGTVESSRFNQKPRTRNPEPHGRRGAAVVHLASNSQVWAIEKILDYLGWSEGGRAGFFRKNFKGAPARMLKTRQANSAITILLTMAASRDIKARRGEETKVSREMATKEMPELKKRIGLGSREE